MFPLKVLQDSEPDAEHTDLRDGSRVRRSGSCNRCGECCVGDPFNGEAGPAQVDGMCPHFAWEGQGEHRSGKCTGRSSDYYKIACAVFPQFPDQVADKPGCSYKFEKLA